MMIIQQEKFFGDSESFVFLGFPNYENFMENRWGQRFQSKKDVGDLKLSAD